MARPLRVEFAGATYHVTSRGNERQAIFRTDDDRLEFLRRLERVRRRFGLVVHAYCLMSNHYHLLVETPRAGLSRAMQVLNSSYSQAFNARHGRCGHVLQGRYHAVVLERDGHLLEVARYVVLNPVRAGLCLTPEQWPWSSYRATVGLSPRPRFLSVNGLLAQLHTDRARAQERYREFVAERCEAPWRGLKRERYLGSDEFVRRHAPGAVDDEEIPRIEVCEARVPLAAIFADHGASATLVAYRDHGYRLSEIARHLGMHYSSVSRELDRLEARISGA